MTDTGAWASLSDQLATRPPVHRAWARIFVPDLAVCLAILAVFCALVFFNAPQTLFLDSKTALEIRTGDRILATHSLPRIDPFLFASGRQWSIPEWGSDVIFALLGLRVLAWLSLILLGLLTWMWVRFHWAAGGNFFLTLVLFVPYLFLIRDHLRATSSLFGWVFLLGFLLYFENAQPRFSVRRFIGIALAAAIWVNLDRSFIFLPIIAALYAVSHVIRPFIWTLDRKQEFLRGKWFALFAAVTLAAGFVSNPYGLHLPDSPAPVPLLMLVIVCAGGVLALTQTRLAHFLLAMLVLIWPAYSLLLLPLINAAITNAFRKSHEFRPTFRKRVTDLLQRSDHVQLIDARFSGLMWTVPAALLLLGWLLLPMVSARIGFRRTDYPVDAAAEFNVMPHGVRVLASPQYGDYLIYRFHGRLPVFVHSGMSEFDDFAALRPGWRDQLAAIGFTHALLPGNSPLAQALESIGWRPIIEDNASVLLKRMP